MPVPAGDIVDLQYYLYKEDVARVAALGINAHSFSYVIIVIKYFAIAHAMNSISWARIFPFGTADSPVNKAGLDHYSDRMFIVICLVISYSFLKITVIDYHIANGVTPVATLCECSK